MLVLVRLVQIEKQCHRGSERETERDEKALSTVAMGLRSNNKQSGSGHLSVTQDVNHTSAGRALRWFLCTEQGHVKRNCLQRSMQKRVGPCFRCNQMSHLMRDCAIIQQTEPKMTTKTQQQYMYAQPDDRKQSITGSKTIKGC